MNRRELMLTALAPCALLGAPSVLPAQTAKTYHVGILSHDWAPERVVVLVNALRDLGYDEGRNIAVESRYSQGQDDRLAGLAAELVAKRVDLIVAIGNREVLAARQATSTIPIVMVSGLTPVESGLIVSLARPGGNVTGTTIQAPEISGKFLELLKEVVPRLDRVGLLWEPDYPGIELYLREAEKAAQALRIRLIHFPIRTFADLEAAFQRAAVDRPGALFVSPTGAIYKYRARVIEFAAQQRLPAIYGSRQIVSEGGLMSYIADMAELMRRTAAIIDRVLKGGIPAEIPVEQPTRFTLAINLKTAKALGITIPQSLLVRADEVVQ